MCASRCILGAGFVADQTALLSKQLGLQPELFRFQRNWHRNLLDPESEKRSRLLPVGPTNVYLSLLRQGTLPVTLKPRESNWLSQS